MPQPAQLVAVQVVQELEDQLWPRVGRRTHSVQEELFQLWRQGKIRPKAATELPLARFGEALAMIRDRTAPGRIALLP